jgi:hypothetical protein
VRFSPVVTFTLPNERSLPEVYSPPCEIMIVSDELGAVSQAEDKSPPAPGKTISSAHKHCEKPRATRIFATTFFIELFIINILSLSYFRYLIS